MHAASRLEVLGTSNLKRHDDVDVQSVLQQPRRFALLVYLALASRKGPVGRDTVVSVFWPESEPARARGALSQALHYLRRSLGRDVIENVDLELLQLNGAVVACDAVEFLDAVDAGDWRQAVELYAGDLLPGFFGSAETVEFEHWLDKERRRLQQEASRCAWSLAQAADDAGETTDAIVWARRACEWSMNDEAEARRLMVFMDRLGDRTGVLDAYERLKSALLPLDVEPSRETKDLVDGLRNRWAADSDGIERDAVDDERTPTPEPKTVPATVRDVAHGVGPAAGRRGRGRRRFRAAGVTLLLAATFTLFWGLRRAALTTPAASPKILVEQLHAESSAPVAVGALGDQIVTHLQAMTTLRIVDGTDGEPARGSPADFILQGGVVRAGGQLAANIHVIDGRTGTTVASKRFERTDPDSLATLDDLGATIAEFTRRSIGAVLEDRRIANADVPEEAITLVQLGRADLQLADSLADARVIEAAKTSYGKADSVLAIASRYAPQWNRPWIERARVALGQMWIHMTEGNATWDTLRTTGDRGVRYANAALERTPGNVEALEAHALLTQYLWNMAPSDSAGLSAQLLAETETDARKVTTLAPHRAVSWNVLGGIAVQRGDWAEAYWALKRAVAADAYMQKNMEIILRLYAAAWETGNMDAAREWCSLATKRLGIVWATARCQMNVAAVMAKPDTALVATLRETLMQQPDWPRIRGSFNALAAVLYARAGARTRARRLLAETHGAADLRADSPLPLQAWAWLELGDKQRARSLLQRYVDGSSARKGILRSRRYSSLNLQ